MKKQIPYEIAFESSHTSLRDVYEKILLRKEQLQEKEFECPWIVEEMGKGLPLILEGFKFKDGIVRSDDELLVHIPKWDGYKDEFCKGFHVFVRYSISKKLAGCTGDAIISYEPKQLRLARKDLANFNEITGLDLKIIAEAEHPYDMKVMGIDQGHDYFSSQK